MPGSEPRAASRSAARLIRSIKVFLILLLSKVRPPFLTTRNRGSHSNLAVHPSATQSASPSWCIHPDTPISPPRNKWRRYCATEAGGKGGPPEGTYACSDMARGTPRVNSNPGGKEPSKESEVG